MQRTENARSAANYFPRLEDIRTAAEILEGVAVRTPLLFNQHLSDRFKANVFLKREDLQVVRSYKIRGAYNRIFYLDEEARKRGIVCASAGNHAQGVAFSCNKLGIKGIVFMPNPTPRQKIDRVKMFGNGYVDIVLTGDTYDDAYNEAVKYASANNCDFIHPFDDPKVIEGQGTLGFEILNDAKFTVDYLLLPVGGGGLAAGVAPVVKKMSPGTKIIGVEPAGAPSMTESIKNGNIIKLENIDRFVDGAAVQQVGSLTFEICRKLLDDMIVVKEGEVCTTILQLYNEEGIVLEPAGALSVAGLNHLSEELPGRNIVCILSGNNNDITRTEEIRERSLLHEGLKHYFIISFPQRAGALKEFVNEVLGPSDDIAYFEYSKKNNRERGPAIVGLELQSKNDFNKLIERMNKSSIEYEYLNNNPNLFQLII